MQDQPVALVTGANQGIGLQIAKDLVAHGFTVLIGSRDFERGEAAAKEVGPDARALQLDVTNRASITAGGGAGSQRVWPPRRTRPKRGDLEYPQAARPIHRGVRKDDPPEQRVPR